MGAEKRTVNEMSRVLASTSSAVGGEGGDSEGGRSLPWSEATKRRKSSDSHGFLPMMACTMKSRPLMARNDMRPPMMP
eukprot:3933342-Rhodomonas_salina.2